jgi:hypothetical protein
MQDSTRTKIIVALAVFVIAGVSIWWYFGFSLEFMKFFAAEPAVTETQQPVSADDTVSKPASIVQCDPEMQTVAVGATASLLASNGDGLYEWFSPQGNPAAGSTFSGGTGTAKPAPYTVSYSTPGIKKVTVQSHRSSGSNLVDSNDCTVIVSP